MKIVAALLLIRMLAAAEQPVLPETTKAAPTAVALLRSMLVANGANPAMGFDLPATLAREGLRFERVRAEAVIQGQGTQYPLSALLKVLQSRVTAAGVATPEQVDTLASGWSPKAAIPHASISAT